MIRHLKANDFKVMPWENGRGQTTEMWREDRAGAMLWRLSRAMVLEDGAFSIFPGVERNLTVISGVGFDLVGAERIRAGLLQPVEFDGDLAIRAEGVLGPCEDFNVMVRRGGMRAEVAVCDGGAVTGLTALFALGPVAVRGIAVGRHELVLTDEAVEFAGRAIVVRLTDLAATG